MDDLIYRQAAIDAMEGLPKYFDTTATLCLDYADVLAVLSEHLPSAEPEPITVNIDHELTQEEYVKLCKDMASAPIVLLPSAQPDIIRCKDCRWWDKYGDYDNGYCMAAKHGYWSEHWEISIRRTYKGDFYCADAERRTDE